MVSREKCKNGEGISERTKIEGPKGGEKTHGPAPGTKELFLKERKMLSDQISFFGSLQGK